MKALFHNKMPKKPTNPYVCPTGRPRLAKLPITRQNIEVLYQGMIWMTGCKPSRIQLFVKNLS
jgi:hypothetical protein